MKKQLEKLLGKLLAKPLQKLARWIERQNAEADAARAAEQSTPTAPAQEKEAAAAGGAEPRDASAAPAAPAHADAVDYSLLDWRWGRFDGRKAVRAAGAEIGSLKVTANGLSYKWLSGGCEDLDRSCSHANSCCTCALFCRVNGTWIGGKFDHISTDRLTRDFANIRESYGGWIPAALSRADAYAFVILDDGAKRRTNVITCGR